MKNNPEMLPCPFCGGEAEIRIAPSLEGEKQQYQTIGCFNLTGCGMQPKTCEHITINQQYFIPNWNTRAQPSVQGVAGVVSAIKRILALAEKAFMKPHTGQRNTAIIAECTSLLSTLSSIPVAVGDETLTDVIAEYLHWRKVNPHIKGGENYLKRLCAALTTGEKAGSDG